jgi:hypothetical protein
MMIAMELMTVLAVLGAVGNAVLSAVLCIISLDRRDEMRSPEVRERVTAGRTRIISPYLDKDGDKK